MPDPIRQTTRFGCCGDCRFWLRATWFVFAHEMPAQFPGAHGPIDRRAGTYHRYAPEDGWGRCRYADGDNALMRGTCEAEGIGGEVETRAEFGCPAFEAAPSPDVQEQTYRYRTQMDSDLRDGAPTTEEIETHERREYP